MLKGATTTFSPVLPYRAFGVGFVMDKVVLGQCFNQVLRFSAVSMFRRMLHFRISLILEIDNIVKLTKTLT
jgi:hypothetical protein